MSIDASKGHPAMDYAEHNRTYAGFLRVSMVLILAIVITLALMAAFLV